MSVGSVSVCGHSSGQCSVVYRVHNTRAAVFSTLTALCRCSIILLHCTFHRSSRRVGGLTLAEGTPCGLTLSYGDRRNITPWHGGLRGGHVSPRLFSVILDVCVCVCVDIQHWLDPLKTVKKQVHGKGFSEYRALLFTAQLIVWLNYWVCSSSDCRPDWT